MKLEGASAARRRSSAPCLAVALLVGIGGGCRSGSKPAAVGVVTWAEMSPSQKHEYMVDVVEPEMREAFQAFDAGRYADFGCATCHRETDGTLDYEMPNPDLPKLDGRGRYRVHRQQQRDVTHFMWRGVTKPMASMLSERAGPRGFECGDCHMVDGP